MSTQSVSFSVIRDNPTRRREAARPRVPWWSWSVALGLHLAGYTSSHPTAGHNGSIASPALSTKAEWYVVVSHPPGPEVSDESMRQRIEASRAPWKARDKVTGIEMVLVLPELISHPGGQASASLHLWPENSNGFSLHAATVVPKGERDLLEKLCRYISRPALCLKRLEVRSDGNSLSSLRKVWRDGTKSFVSTPQEFIAKLAALVPHPREHQLTYQGVLAPASPLRDQVVPRPVVRKEPKEVDASDSQGPREESPGSSAKGPAYIRWADLLKRIFAEDVSRPPTLSWGSAHDLSDHRSGDGGPSSWSHCGGRQRVRPARGMAVGETGVRGPRGARRRPCPERAYRSRLVSRLVRGGWSSGSSAQR
ncbi:MAG: hypothetical protein ACJAZN_003427 [Planctomycetota bacterium]|jgi:hypothetical protein